MCFWPLLHMDCRYYRWFHKYLTTGILHIQHIELHMDISRKGVTSKWLNLYIPSGKHTKLAMENGRWVRWFTNFFLWFSSSWCKNIYQRVYGGFLKYGESPNHVWIFPFTKKKSMILGCPHFRKPPKMRGTSKWLVFNEHGGFKGTPMLRNLHIPYHIL